MRMTLDSWLDDYENGHASLEDLPQGSLSQPLKELNGMTLLHIFALWGYEDAVRHILRHGADVMARMPHGETPLHCAAARGELEVCRELVRVGGDRLRNAKTDEGCTARQYAERYFSPHKYRTLDDYSLLLTLLD